MRRDANAAMARPGVRPDPEPLDLSNVSSGRAKPHTFAVGFLPSLHKWKRTRIWVQGCFALRLSMDKGSRRRRNRWQR